MLVAILMIKLIAEIALLALLGQWLLGLLAGAKKDSNLFYKILSTMTQPFVRLARFITPGFVLERHVPLVAFLILAFIWLAALILKIQTCLTLGIEVCQ